MYKLCAISTYLGKQLHQNGHHLQETNNQNEKRLVKLILKWKFSRIMWSVLKKKSIPHIVLTQILMRCCLFNKLVDLILHRQPVVDFTGISRDQVTSFWCMLNGAASPRNWWPRREVPTGELIAHSSHYNHRTLV